MMSELIHARHSVELLEYVTRRYNGVIGYNLIQVKSNYILINFPLYTNADRSIIITLFSKLAEAFKVIKNKYITKEENHHHVQVRFSEDEEYFRIKITGSLYIPTGKFLKLYSLILWYYIRYTTGQKPSSSNMGKKLSESWKGEDKSLRKEINSLSRKKVVSYSPYPCNICGDATYMLNAWKLKLDRLSVGNEIQTYVCERHRDRLI